MAVALDDVKELVEDLGPDYEKRHSAFRKLRAYWHGDYWDMADDDNRDITSVFRDIVGKRSDVGPDIKVVDNVLQEVCLKYQTFLSPLPMVQMFVDPPATTRRKAQANTKERFVYGSWHKNDMASIFADAGWYLPLMGHAYLGIWPDFDTGIPKAFLRSPENAYPIPGFERGTTSGIIFKWSVSERWVDRSFPNYVPQADRNPGKTRFMSFGRRRTKEGSYPKVDLIEYGDDNEVSRWAGDQRLVGVEHGWGINLFEEMKFINVPGEVWGHGAVEQTVAMNEIGNALYSLLFTAILENVFPTLFLINPQKAPETLDLGAGGVVGLNEGGDAKWMSPPTAALASHMGFSEVNRQRIMDATGLNDASRGIARNSIITGKAINALQGAGTGSLVEMVQGTGLGKAVVNWNAKAIFMVQQMFREETLELYGLVPSSHFDIKGQPFSDSIKGKELIGSGRNDVIFSPQLNMHEKVVMGLQLKGGGLVSNDWIRNQIGIPDSVDMDEQIFSETIDAAVLQAVAQAIVASGDPAQAESVEQQAISYLNGGSVRMPAAAPPAPGLAPPGGAPSGGGPPIGPLGGGGSALSPALKLPPGSPPPVGSQPPSAQPQPEQSNVVTLDEVTQALQGVDTQGRVFVVGELAQTGQTTDQIELSLTDGSDRQTIADALQQYAGRLVFHVIAGEPSEEFVEVTPGASPQRGGSPSDLAALIGG